MPPTYDDPLSLAQDRLVAAIQAAPLVAACQVPVEPERRGDIQQTIQNALNQLGAAVVVLEPVNGNLPEPDAPDLLTEVEFVVECVENVLFNRSQVPSGNLPADPDANAAGRPKTKGTAGVPKANTADGDPTGGNPPRATALQILAAVLAVHDQPTGLLNPHHPLGRWRLRAEGFRRLPHKTLSIYQASFTAGVDLNPPPPPPTPTESGI